MNKIFSSILTLTLITSVFGFTANAQEIEESNSFLPEANQQQVINIVEDFILEAYSEYYDMSNFESKIANSNYEENKAEFEVMVNFDKELKALNVQELPTIQGMTATVKTMEKSRSADAPIAKYILDNQIENVNEYIGEIQNENAIFKVTIDITDTDLSNATLEVFGVDEFIPAEYFRPYSSEKLYDEGTSDIEEVVVSTKEMISTAYPDLDVNNLTETQLYKLKNARAGIKYDRVAARDYANTYTSECGNSYNTKYWNPDYAWHTESGGVDCANYVSQAIYAGGIPTDSTWKPESTAWVNTGKNISNGLKQYMTNKGYFDKVTRSTCAAGGFIEHTDFSHVIFVVANDTVTMQFSSHTADRLKASFAGSYYKDFEYYYINSAYVK